MKEILICQVKIVLNEHFIHWLFSFEVTVSEPMKGTSKHSLLLKDQLKPIASWLFSAGHRAEVYLHLSDL